MLSLVLVSRGVLRGSLSLGIAGTVDPVVREATVRAWTTGVRGVVNLLAPDFSFFTGDTWTADEAAAVRPRELDGAAVTARATVDGGVASLSLLSEESAVVVTRLARFLSRRW